MDTKEEYLVKSMIRGIGNFAWPQKMNIISDNDQKAIALFKEECERQFWAHAPLSFGQIECLFKE